MIEGMGMDTKERALQEFWKSYIYLLCYHVAGTTYNAAESLVPAQTTYNAALYVGIGNQEVEFSNPKMNLPSLGVMMTFFQELSLKCGVFMKHEIAKARFYSNLAEEGPLILENPHINTNTNSRFL